MTSKELAQEAMARFKLKKMASDKFIIAKQKIELAAANKVILNLKRKNNNLERENEKLKKQLKDAENKDRETKKEFVDLGQKTMISKTAFDRIIESFCATPSRMARELMMNVFSHQELTTSSISGKQSNANKGHPIRPKLNPKKIEAILKFTFDFHNIGNDQLKIQKITTSLVGKLNEFRKKMERDRDEMAEEDEAVEEEEAVEAEAMYSDA